MKTLSLPMDADLLRRAKLTALAEGSTLRFWVQRTIADAVNEASTAGTYTEKGEPVREAI